MKRKIKNWKDYFHVRSLIEVIPRYLAMMLLFCIATVIVTSVEQSKENIYVVLSCVTGMLFYFFMYLKAKKFYLQYRSYTLYEVKKSTGTVHMRIVDLYRRFKGRKDEDIKEYLIDRSYKDFVEIFNDYKESSDVSRAIQTHKSFARPFMRALRDSDLVVYDKDELRRFFKDSIETNGDIDTLEFPETNGYKVTIMYLGCLQNKMIALRKPITRCTDQDLKKFGTVIPYYEITVTRA